MAKGKKTGGRVQGTPNQVTKELRTLLLEVVTDQLNNISEILQSIEAKERLEIIIKTLPYLIPKMQSIGINEIKKPENTENQKIDFSFEQLMVLKYCRMPENDCTGCNAFDCCMIRQMKV